MYYRGPGGLAVVWPGSFPLPFPPFSSASGLSFWFSCVSPVELTDADGGGEGEGAKDSEKAWSSKIHLLLSGAVHFIGRSVGGCTVFCWAEYLEFLVANPKCMQSSCSAKVYVVLLQCQCVCSLVAVSKCMHYAVLLQCLSVYTMESCCSAK
jgi:hypothetical protein